MLRQTGFVALLALAASLPAVAQRPGGLGATRLERAGLEVGMELPDVTVYNAQGEKFALRSLRGQHAVLVFGCLT